MNMLDRDGVFKAKIADHGVGQTQNGYPQWVAEFTIDEMYDEETGEWTPWSEYDMGITGYLVLFGGNEKPTSNVAQIKTATGWTGRTFVSLSEMNLSDKTVLIRVESSEFKGKERRQVVWVDHQDASPVRQLRKLDTTGIKGLDSKYAATLAGSATAPPAKAPVKAPVRSAAPAPTQTPSQPPTQAQPVATAADTSAKKRGPKPKLPPPPPALAPAGAMTNGLPKSIPPPPPQAATPSGKNWPKECTLDEAWTAVMGNLSSEANADAASEMWLKQIDEKGGDESTITPTQWGEIRDAIDKVFGIPF